MVIVNDEEIEWYEGMTVSDLLSGIKDSHLYWIVKINDQYITKPHFNSSEIPDGCEVILVPVFAGG